MIVLNDVISPPAQCAERCVCVCQEWGGDLKTGSHYVTLASFKLRDPTCLYLPRAGIKGECHHTQPLFLFFEQGLCKFRLAFNS